MDLELKGIKVQYLEGVEIEEDLDNEISKIKVDVQTKRIFGDLTDDEKEELSDAFAEKYEGKVQEFIDFISDEEIAVPGEYKETWKYIEKGINSLQRHSNMHLIFE